MTNKNTTRISTFKYLCAGFGIGYAPKGPGTAGTILMCLIMWGIYQFAPSVFGAGLGSIMLSATILSTLFFGGWYMSEEIVKADGTDKDPQYIVIDEMAGMWLSMFLIPFNWQYLLLAFILFRAFDIMKPSYVGWADQNLKGGLGIMLDDIIAAAFTNVIMHFVVWGVHAFL